MIRYKRYHSETRKKIGDMMPETTQVTGVISKVTRRDGEAFGLALKDRDGYLNYSKPEYRGEKWDDHAEGDEVLLDVSDGKWIKAIKVLAKAEPTFTEGAGGQGATLPTTDWGPKRRLDALQLAQNACLSLNGTEQAGDFGQAVVKLAAQYVAFIEGSGGQE